MTPLDLIVFLKKDSATRMAGEPALRDLLAVAQEAAWVGGRRTLAYFRTGTVTEWKSDQTPVTAADRESEQLIRAVV